MSYGHLVQFPNADAYEQADLVLMHTNESYCGFGDHRLLLSNRQIAAVKEKGIPFDYLSGKATA